MLGLPAETGDRASKCSTLVALPIYAPAAPSLMTDRGPTMPSPIGAALQLLRQAAGLMIWPMPRESASTRRGVPFTARNAIENVCLLSELLPMTALGSPTPTLGFEMRTMFGVRAKPTYSAPLMGSSAVAVG